MTRARRNRGYFVSFEGIEGSGKTTHAALLASWLESRGWSVISVREPGGTPLGEGLRSFLLECDGEGIADRSELLMYLAARAQLVERRILPALAEGRIVIADRFADASVAYQGGGRRLGLDVVRRLVRFATGGLTPDRTYLLDIRPETGLARVNTRGRLDRLEKERMTFHRRVRASYRAIARAEPRRILLLKADQPQDRLSAAICADLDPRISRRALNGALSRSGQ